MTKLFFAEPTLSVANLLRVIEKIPLDERRRGVWKEMLSHDSIVDEIYRKHTNSKERADTLADVYINMWPGSTSWQYVLSILYDEGELAATKEAKSFLPQNGGCAVQAYHFVLVVRILVHTHLLVNGNNIVHTETCEGWVCTLWLV